MNGQDNPQDPLVNSSIQIPRPSPAANESKPLAPATNVQGKKKQKKASAKTNSASASA